MDGSNLLNIIQTRLLLTDNGNNGNHGSMIVNLFIIQSFNALKQVLPKVCNFIYENYIKKCMQRQMKQISKVTNTLISSVKLVKNYKDIHSNNEFNKVDGVMNEIISIHDIHSLTYNGSYYYFNFYDIFNIEKNIKFKLISIEFDKDKTSIERIEFELFSETMNVQYIKQYIEKCYEKYDDIRKNKLKKDLCYFDSQYNEFSNNINKLEFRINKFKTNKHLRNIFFSKKSELEKRIHVYMNNPEWYEKNGIPYTFGLLLYGEPGCGKTSTIKALANTMSRHVININLNILKTNKQLNNLFHSDYINIINEVGTNEQIYIPIYKRLYVFEDIDCMNNNIVLKRDDLEQEQNRHSKKEQKCQEQVQEKIYDGYDQYSQNNFLMFDTDKFATDHEKKSEVTDKFLTSVKTKSENKDKDPITLSSLLNILDGTLETPGRIIIMTTNHRDKLDPALIRPGRIDMCIEFTKSTPEMIIDMYENLYNEKFPIQHIHKLSNLTLSPATVIQILFRHINSPQDSINELCVKIE